MSCEVLPTIFNLLSTVCLQYQEVALVNQLNNFFSFDHNIFLMDSSIDHNLYITTSLKSKNDGNYTPQSLYTFKLVEGNITGLENLKEIRSKNTFLIVVLESSIFESNIQILTHVNVIQRLNSQMKIGVFFSNTVSMDSIHKLFNWFWKHRILQIFSAFYVNDEKLRTDPVLNAFKFSPFGTFVVINVTKSEFLGDYFPSKLSNFQQYPLRVPIIETEIFDYDTKLWEIVLDMLNASVLLVQVNDTMTPKQVISGDIDILPHLHLVREYLNVYPMGMDKMVIVVPQALPFSNFMAYLKRITSALLFGCSFITIVAVTLSLTITNYVKKKKILFFQCVADVLNLLMNDNASIKYQQLNRADVCLIVPLTFAGFVVVNGILSTFQSYLTLPVIQPQINTIEDLYLSPFPILAPGEFWASEVTKLLEHVSDHGGWNDKILSLDLLEIDQQIFEFNASIAFPTFISQAKMLLDVQKRLDIRGYHIPTETYLVKSMHSYSVNNNFPFIERLNDIIHSLREAGLYDKWVEEQNEMVVKKLLKTHRGSQMERNNDSDIDSFPVPTIVCYGWIASVIVFIGEIIWQKFKLTKKKRMRKFYLIRE